MMSIGGCVHFLEGKVLCDYNFDIKDYNHKAYREFINLLNGG